MPQRAQIARNVGRYDFDAVNNHHQNIHFTMIPNTITNEFLKELRLNFGGIAFESQSEGIVPNILTHDYLLSNFDVSTEIEKYYFLPCKDMFLDEDYEEFVRTGYVGNKETTLRPYPFSYKGAYIPRKLLYYRLLHLQNTKLKYKGKLVTSFYDLFPFLDDYRDGFENGYQNFEKDCVERYLLPFADKSDFIIKVFEYVTKEIIFSHSWRNNHSGFTVSYLAKINNKSELGEITDAFEDGKFQGYFYRAWSIILSNNKQFESLFKLKVQTPEKINSVLENLLEACYKMQQSKHFWKADEDTKTRQVLDLLPKEYHSKDQSKYGVSSAGIKPGSVDGVLEFNNVEYFLEAFNLKGFNRSYIKLHLDKLEKSYDSKGLREKYLIIYYKLEDHKFESEVEKYKNYLEKEHAFIYTKIDKIEERETKYSDSSLLKTVHNREGKKVSIYHLLLKFPK